MLKESSPDTPQGSFTDDLNKSKVWICRVLDRLELTQFDSVYVLGSWYGSMSLWLLHFDIEFDHLYAVDWDREKTEYVKHVIKRAHLSDRISAIRADANKVNYQGNRILVINTSTNDIEGREWLNNIPRGSIVVLQGRDHQELSNGIETIDSFDRAYPLSETLYLGSIVVEDHEGYNYLRFMKIGVK